MHRIALLILCAGLSVAVAADEPLLDHDDTLATALLPEAFQPDDSICCDGEPLPAALAADSAATEPNVAPEIAAAIEPPGDGGLLGFARECAEIELVPLKSLHESEERRMMLGVDFDGVLGLFVLTR